MKQHPLCTDCEQNSDVMDLPIPAGLKREWAALETRRRFLGRSGRCSDGQRWRASSAKRRCAGDALAADVQRQASPERHNLEAAAFCAEGETGDLSVHVGRPAAN